MLVFAHIEKTAGTTAKFILRNNFGNKHCDAGKNKKKIFTQADLEHARKIFGKVQCISGHNLVEPTKHLIDPGLKFMTFLRNPITRTASFYQDSCLRRNNKQSFEQWIQDESRHNMQVKRIAGSADLEKAKRLLAEKYFFVGLTERFDDSIKLLKLLYPTALNMKYKIDVSATDNSIKNRLLNTPDTLKILEEANQLDMELYHFVKEELFPERINTYREQLEYVRLPRSQYKNHFTWNYQKSIFFNKYVYRQFIKLEKRLVQLPPFFRKKPLPDPQL